MKEMKMLDLDRIDLGQIAMALEDHSFEHQWLLDPRTGETWMDSEYGDDAELDTALRERGLDRDALVPIEPRGSREGYRDMEDFIERIRDPKAHDLLDRAIAGRGAFRRFKDTLFDFPELREAWFAFHDARVERRAIEWLRSQALVDEAQAERAIDARPDPAPPELSGVFDPHEVARAVAAELRQLYGERLREVILFGSWARGDAHPESDIDLLVVLDRVESSWEERKRMDDILWRHSLENDTVVVAIPVAEERFRRAGEPVLINARREGVAIR
jgi:predicted nucleotidyltransferase